MPIDFYHSITSSPCRAVALTAEAVGVEMNFIPVNVMKGDQLKPEYLKMNPQHTIPTINDNGFCLWESRAIMTYLVEQYGTEDLYPKDPKKRAIVNQRLYFDACTLYESFAKYFYPMIFARKLVYGSQDEKLNNALAVLDKFLEGEEYVAGKNLTIADLAIVATISTIEVLEYDLSNYKNVTRWFSKMKSELPKYKELSEPGVTLFKNLVDAEMKKPAK